MFVELKKAGDEFIALIDPSNALTLVAGFKALAAAWFISYVVYIGYLHIAGKNNSPLSDIVQRFIIYGIISMFAFNIGGWYDNASKIVEDFSAWASTAGSGIGGVTNIYGRLDGGWQLLLSFHEMLMSDINVLEVLAALERILSMAIIYSSYALVSLFITILLIFNKLILTLLLFTLPIAVVSLFFTWTKGIFERWLEMVISNVLNILFIAMMFNAMFNKVADYIESNMLTVGENMVPLAIAFSFAFLMIFVFAFIMLGVLFSNKFAKVSANSLPMGAITSTAIAAAVTGKVASKGASVAGKGASVAGKGAVGAGNSAHSLYKSRQSNILNTNRSGGIPTSSKGGNGGSGNKGSGVSHKPLNMSNVDSPASILNTNRGGGIRNAKNSEGVNKGGSRASSSPSSTKGNTHEGVVSAPPSSPSSRKSQSGSKKWGRIGAINKAKRNR